MINTTVIESVKSTSSTSKVCAIRNANKWQLVSESEAGRVVYPWVRPLPIRVY